VPSQPIEQAGQNAATGGFPFRFFEVEQNRPLTFV
jgi:hypothetical protein